MKRYLILFLIVACACDSLDDLPTAPSKLVVDGFIEQGEFPLVYLTLSSDFYAPVDSISLLDLIVTTARVAVSDGTNEEVLTLFRNTEFFPPFYYRGTDLRGEVGKTYRLHVTSRGEEYIAYTTIPKPVALDSIWYERDEESDSLATLWIEFEDPELEVNYYRTFTRRFNLEDIHHPSYQSTLSDRAFNGRVFSHPVLKQPEEFSNLGDDVFFQTGDTISLKFATMDVAHFEFWRTLERELYTAGNPFGSSGNEVISNIEGTLPALGVWGGYGVTYGQVIIR